MGPNQITDGYENRFRSNRQMPNKNNISKNWHIGVSQKVDIKV